jgi:hypothetical protein
MPERLIRRVLTLSALAILSSIAALAQAPAAPAVHARTVWQSAQLTAPSKGKLFVVTADQPNRRQTCHVQSFTVEKLVCSRAIGDPHTYLPQQVIALILPGDGHLKLYALLGLNSALGAAIWGTVVLAAMCPPCAVVTGIAAFLIFDVAGAIAIGDDLPDRLLYLVPGQQLSSKVGVVEP